MQTWPGQLYVYTNDQQIWTPMHILEFILAANKNQLKAYLQKHNFPKINSTSKNKKPSNILEKNISIFLYHLVINHYGIHLLERQLHWELRLQLLIDIYGKGRGRKRKQETVTHTNDNW